VWGAGIAKHFAIPYNCKLWSVDLKAMETSWLGEQVPLPDLEDMIEGALRPVPKPMGPNARFGYPLRGGFQALMNGFLPHVRDRLRLNARVVAISPRRHTASLADGTEIEYGHLISTMPLPELVRSLGEEAPVHVRRARVYATSRYAVSISGSAARISPRSIGSITPKTPYFTAFSCRATPVPIAMRRAGLPSPAR
jgi:UDP-galactopyranose mutase